MAGSWQVAAPLAGQLHNWGSDHCVSPASRSREERSRASSFIGGECRRRGGWAVTTRNCAGRGATGLMCTIHARANLAMRGLARRAELPRVIGSKPAVRALQSQNYVT